MHESIIVLRVNCNFVRIMHLCVGIVWWCWIKII